MPTYQNLFNFDALAMIAAALVIFIGLCVSSFARRYMKGDSQYRMFFIQLTGLVIALTAMVSADHLALLFGTWCIANALLVRLMIHKKAWKAARASGRLASAHYLLGAACIAAAFSLLYAATGSTSIHYITHQQSEYPQLYPALILLLIGAMTQSAIWPFHKWLVSSLNSPTPVSAIMHAGLVNGGGFLLARFAPLYLGHPGLLSAIFAIGLITALVGTFWKLMQNDVKRMLACSTMGQMGFMLAQTGLGLFPAAVAHLVWHGMFKAYLFLASGSAAQERRYDPGYPPKPLAFIGALLCGVFGSLAFAYASDKTWLANDTTLVLMVVSYLAACQLALPLLKADTLRNLPLAVCATATAGLAYGGSVHLIAYIMDPMQLMQPQPLNSIHIMGIAALILAWLSILFLRNQTRSGSLPGWMLHGYVAALNASQPHPATITVHRNHYRY